MNEKYEITDIAHPRYPWLHRIRALRDIREDVHAGDLGGFVQSEDNLSIHDPSWIYGDAIACEDAYVSQNAALFQNAVVKGSAVILGQAQLSGFASVEDSAIVQDGKIEGYAHVSGYGQIQKNAVSGIAPHITDYASVYGIVSGNITVMENAVVLPGVRMENPTPDSICILQNKQIVERSTDRAMKRLVPPPEWEPPKKKHSRMER